MNMKAKQSFSLFLLPILCCFAEFEEADDTKPFEETALQR